MWLTIWCRYALPPGLLAFATVSLAQYNIDWFTVDSGGGTSTGGHYSISGTIGQMDAGVVGGDRFTLVGGFWVLPVAVQTPDAPRLSITPAAPGSATVSWDPAVPGFVLQVSDTLAPPAWTNAPTGATTPVTVPATLPHRFYRLSKP